MSLGDAYRALSAAAVLAMKPGGVNPLLASSDWADASLTTSKKTVRSVAKQSEDRRRSIAVASGSRKLVDLNRAISSGCKEHMDANECYD